MPRLGTADRFETVSTTTPRRIFKYWYENNKVKVRFGVNLGRPRDPAPDNAGTSVRTGPGFNESRRGPGRRWAQDKALPGKVVAELMFGFWRYLSVSGREITLWRPYLHQGFVTGTSRSAVDDPMNRLHRLRNRVAQHELLLTQNLPARRGDVLAKPRIRGPYAPQEI
jgi:hypothetical protein